MHVEVKANCELSVVVESVHRSLSVAVPDDHRHVVGGTGKDVGVVRRELDSSDGKCMVL